MGLRIGTSGWNYDHWKARFYPDCLPKSDWLSFYERHFDTVEVNFSFYRWPSVKTLQRWESEAGDGFLFTMKVPKTITHNKKLHNVERYLADFYKLTVNLKEHLGAHLFQLPPSFDKSEKNLSLFRSFLRSLDREKENVIEFRHKSWYDQDVFDAVRSAGAVVCAVSGHGMPWERVDSKSAAYFRFHGAPGSYSMARLKMYLEDMQASHAARVYAYFNNDEQAHAVRNASMLKSLAEMRGLQDCEEQ